MATKVMNGLDLQNQRIQSVGSPSAGTDAANKDYVDARVAGAAWKASVRAASTANVTLASAVANGSTLDGVTLATGDRILLKNQTAPAENGIWIVAASGAPARATDADETAELANATVFVREGSTLADTAWVQTADVTTVGTTGQTWVQFGAGGGGSTYTADGEGITLVGSEFQLALDGTTLSKSASGLRIGSGAAGVGLTESSGVLAVNAGTASATGLETSGDTVRIAAAAAGDGLNGGGGSPLSVDVGAGLEIATGAVAVNLATSSGLSLAGGELAIDTSTVVRKYAVACAASTSTVVTHNLGTRDVTVSVVSTTTPWEHVLCDVESTSTNTVTVRFAEAPAAGAYRIVVHG